ncbi:MAG: hypothetical protein QNJ30_10345 [Kiloniellales bacterium]|nr:hypothetical protein [Kiloniellales bacterium]
MTEPPKTTAPSGPALSAEEIRRIVGDISDARILAILDLHPSLDELEQAVAWAEGQSDVLGELELPLSGVVGELHEILTAGEEWEEDQPTA